MITFRGVGKSYGGTTVVHDLEFEVKEGELLVLLGPSGCGKTTTLKMINRLIEPSRGTIEIDGRANTAVHPVELRRSIGYVFQDIGLFPHFTVRENAGIVGRLLGMSRREAAMRVDQVLTTVGLDPEVFRDRFPSQLSGGQQQRVGIARALAAEPSYLLMDEPFGALDAVTREALQAELLKLNKTLRKTIIFVTHDLFEAVRLGDRIAVMAGGRIEQIGTPRALMDHPETGFVRELFDRARAQAALVGASV